MNSILNNKKIRIFSLVMVLASMISVGVFIQSCSNEDINDNLRDAPPKLKSLMTSSEYINTNEHIESFGKELKTNYSKLSVTEQEKVINILNEMQGISDAQEDVNKLFGEFHAITKINFKIAIDKFSEDFVKLRLYNDQNNISNKEFVLAINKYSSGGIPRLKNGFEVGDATVDCVGNCMITHLACMLLCLATGPGAPVCEAACWATFALCCLMCPD
jgi:hypothetical protein